MGNVKMLTANLIKKKKNKMLESVSWTVWDCACWHQAGHEVTQVQDGATRHHFSRQQSRMGCEESCSSSIWTHTSMSHPSESRREGRFVIYGGDVINSPVTCHHFNFIAAQTDTLLHLSVLLCTCWGSTENIYIVRRAPHDNPKTLL